MKTRILTNDEPLDNILLGASKLYNAVKVTMGPRGSNVIFRKAGKKVAVTHDGVTVAKSVKLNDPAEDVAADLLREAAMKLDSTTGDGTTTVTVLAYNILKYAAEVIHEGENPMKVKLSIEKQLPRIIEKIKENILEATEERVVQIAKISSGDAEIGEEVGRAVYEAGKDVPVILGFSDSSESHIEVINGIKIDAGSASPYLMDSSGVKVEIDNPKIIVADAKFREKEDILPILKVVSSLPPEERQILLVASDVAGDALKLLVINHLKEFARIAIVKVPESIVSHTEYLSDIAVSVGATLLSKNTGNTIANPDISHFGSSEKVIVRPLETVIVNGRFIPEDVQSRMASLTDLAKDKDSGVRKFAEQRLKFLNQKILSIHVGGQSESDAEEKHYRYEDAVGASMAALRGGVVPGGGTVLYRISDNYSYILANALKAPLEIVLSNAGIEVPEGILIGYGIDVMNPQEGLTDLVERGVLDPAESEIECVKTAVSIAGLLMTSGAIIIDEEEDETKQPFSIS